MTPTERPSIDTNLEQRYTNQHVGSAYDAKSIRNWGSHAPLENSSQSRRWTKPGFRTNMNSTEFTKPEGSMYLDGHSNKKYQG